MGRREKHLYDGSQALDVGLFSLQQEPHHMMPHLLLHGVGGEEGDVFGNMQ